jgi:hypothetical protein
MTSTAVHQQDRLTQRHWLTFAGRTPQDISAELQANGWRWSRYREAWHTNRRYPVFPAGIEITEGDPVDYAAERADRLTDRAANHQQQAEAAWQRSHAIAEHIPLGQPILVGHHSEQRHRRDLQRIDHAARQGYEEEQTAQRLREAAQSSTRHQAKSQTPGAIARRLERYRAELRSVENRKRAGDYESPTGTAHYARIVADLEQRIQETQDALTAAGGLPADSLEVHPGDVVQIKNWVCRIVRVNAKSVTVTYEHYPDWGKTTYSKTFITAVISRGPAKQA